MIKIKIPIRLLPPNQIKHWTQRHKQNKIAKLLLRSEFNKLKERPKPPALIRLTRIAPRRLDSHDSLPQSFKGIVDILADLLVPGLAPGQADGDNRLSFVYDQKKGASKEYAIEIQIIKRGEGAGPWEPSHIS